MYQPFGIIGFNFTTGTVGSHDQRIAVPNLTSLLGLWTYWQSIVVDAAAPGGVGLTLSRAFEAKFGDWTYTNY